MTDAVRQAARQALAPLCGVCASCNGIACKGRIPGPGGQDAGRCFVRNVEAFEGIRVCLDTIYEERPVDTSVTLFGRTFAYPFFAAPIGLVAVHYNSAYDDQRYCDTLVPACRDGGIAAFTGDSMVQEHYFALCDLVGRCGGVGVPTVKPWPVEIMKQKIAYAAQAGAMAVACDIDASGLMLLKQGSYPVAAKSVAELKEVAASTPLPFILKGVMTAQGACKAAETGAYAIVVSNHGGRVLDDAEATASVLPEIAAAVRGRVKVFVDGGIRTGADVFKAIALGADAVLIGRPFVPVAFGGGGAAVVSYIERIGKELRDTMLMTGAKDIASITAQMIRTPDKIKGGTV